jgi:hypothetical protein
MNKRALSPQERFDRYVFPVTESGCWIWMGAVHQSGGHGVFGHPGGTIAHRYAWAAARGPIPDGLQVCHHCDIACCVNPDHLYVGTQLDNMRDRKVRGRANTHVGEKNGAAKLTEQQVREIIASKDLQFVIAARYGVSNAVISKIKRGDRWKHVHRQITAERLGGAPERITSAHHRARAVEIQPTSLVRP